MEMFCYQCEQTMQGSGCTKHGVCGKSPEVAALQDLLVHATKGLAQFAHRNRQRRVVDRDIDRFTIEALFSTITNVDFDPERLAGLLHRAFELKERAKGAYTANERLEGPAAWEPAEGLAALEEQGRAVSIEKRKERFGDTIAGLQELITYGLKGMAAYADHAAILGQESDDVSAFFHEALDFLANEPTEVGELLAMVDRVGATNLTVMGMLDTANTDAYGTPEPTEVRVTPVKGKAIVVSGHDLKDLGELLTQTEGKGINVYTHGEMLPCHAYPELKKFKHLVGNYGGAWQDQQKEFDAFPGAILMTTNCIQMPQKSYKDRIFTSGLVAWPGVTHISDENFAPVIEAALAEPGFTEDAPEQKIMVGFGHDAVLGVADKVIDAVKGGAIKHLFLIGGCDGAKPGRNYYTEFAEQVPNDCVILTLACGKYRFNKMSFGDIGGIPRLLDCGQCNDAYSAIQIATALAKAFDCSVNDLPLSLVLSWYEQKAVCILLTLLHLGIQNMRLGPTLPAFVTPDVLKVLVEKYHIMPTTTPEKDLRTILE